MIRPTASIRVLTAAALASTLLVPGAATALGTSRADFTLRLDLRPAPLIAGKRIATLTEAIRAFGRPARIVPLRASRHACRASWPGLALAIDFSTTAPAACSVTALGNWSEVIATDSPWHTTAGLRVADSSDRLHALYPTGRRLDFLHQGPLWELETGGPYCDGGPPLSLAARVLRNRVTALLIVHVPACG
jgi:hypothetical protein